MFNPVTASTAPEINITFDDFKNGVVTLVNSSRLPFNAVVEATNLMQYQDGRWGTRWGTATYGVDFGATIDGAHEYRKSDGTTELITVAGGTAYKSANGGSKTALTGASFTSGTLCRFKQIASRLYIVNGVDPLTYYDGTNLITYTTISVPQSAALARAGLTAGTAATLYYQVVAVNSVGFSLPSTAASITVNKTRDQWTVGTDSLTLTWSAPATGAANVLRYEIYYSDQAGFEVYLGSSDASILSFKDTGEATANPYIQSPIDNTTTGPVLSDLELSGNRLWGVDAVNKYRIYGSGSGSEMGYFSSFYGGFYVELEKGGREYPSKVKHFRDGKGSAVATVFTSAPDGTGSTWQVDLVDQTVGDTSFIIPTTSKVVGGLGTSAPDSTIEVRDAIYFANKKGVYSLGSKPSLLNVLATDELSANIRPTWRGLTGSAVPSICSYFFDAKVFISVPAGSATQNSQTMVFDTERRNWNPKAFSIGFRQFLDYTDTSGNTHFLAVSYSGNKMIELSQNILGDQGVAFSTSLLTGLIPVQKDRTKFAKVTDAIFEFDQPQGSITIEFLGTTKQGSFNSLSDRTITDAASNSGWDSFQWDSAGWNSPTLAPTSFSQSSLKKRLRVNKRVNNFQLHISTTNINTQYTLLGVQVKGYPVPTKYPSSWKT